MWEQSNTVKSVQAYEYVTKDIVAAIESIDENNIIDVNQSEESVGILHEFKLPYNGLYDFGTLKVDYTPIELVVNSNPATKVDINGLSSLNTYYIDDTEDYFEGRLPSMYVHTEPEAYIDYVFDVEVRNIKDVSVLSFFLNSCEGSELELVSIHKGNYKQKISANHLNSISFNTETKLSFRYKSRIFRDSNYLLYLPFHNTYHQAAPTHNYKAGEFVPYSTDYAIRHGVAYKRINDLSSLETLFNHNQFNGFTCSTNNISLITKIHGRSYF